MCTLACKIEELLLVGIVFACMQNRAITGWWSCFLFIEEKEYAFSSKMLHRSTFHWTLTCIISLVQCVMFAKGRVEESNYRSFSHLRSRKWQHSHSSPVSVKTGKILPGPTRQGWPARFTKGLCKFWILVKGLGRRTQILNSAGLKNSFPTSSNPG